MQKKTIWKDTFREIKRSKTRFLAILLIILIGVAFFVGISATGPDMMATIRQYFDDQELMDHRIVSNYGLTDDDLATLNDQEGVTVQGHYTADVTLEESQDTMRFYSYHPDQKINQYVITEGRLPEKPGEIALDNTPDIKSQWQIGDEVTIDWSGTDSETEKPLKRSSFKVVGFVASPLYIEHTSRGHTNAGSGVLHGFGVIHPDDFNLDVYTEAYLVHSSANDYPAYSDKYADVINQKGKELDKLLSKRGTIRHENLLSDIKDGITDGEKEIAQAKNRLASARHQLASAQSQYNQGRQQFKAGFQTFQNHISQAEDLLARHENLLQSEASNLAQHEAILRQAQSEIDEGRTILEEKEAELIPAKNALMQIKRAQGELSEAQEKIAKQQEDLNSQLEQKPRLEKGLALLNQLGVSSIPAVNRSEAQSQIEQLKQKEADWAASQDSLNQQAATVENKKAELTKLNQQLAQMDELETDELEGISRQAILDQINNLQQEITNFEEKAKSLQETERQIASEKQQLGQIEPILEAMEAQGIQSLPALSVTDLEQKLSALNQGQSKIDAAQDEIKAKQAAIDEAQKQFSSADTERIEQGETLLANKKTELNQQEKQIQAAWQKIHQGKSALLKGQNDIQKGQQELQKEASLGAAELAEKEQILAESKEKLEQGKNELADKNETAQSEIASGEEKLENAREQLDQLPDVQYFIFDRSDNPGYSEYEDNAERMNAIAGVFPVFFFFIAILISLTTMTRMVDEEREYIGTMKALGYRNREILIKFVTYAFLATLAGVILGLFIGYQLFPRLIFNAYASLYNLSPITIKSYPLYTALAVIAAFISTVGATLYAVSSSLKSNAARLLRPKAPKKGTHILLEKIPAIWERLSFNYKITFRNVFRYKTRMLMTIFGVAGSTALILTGFGISDSISDIPRVQYDEINQFQAYVAIDQNADAEDLNQFTDATEQSETITDYLPVMQETITFDQEDINPQNALMMVPESPDQIQAFIDLTDPQTGEKLDLPDEGVLITQKLAELLNVGVGDSVTGESPDGEKWSLKIAGIVRNYVGHFIYLKPDVYTQITGYQPEVTQHLIKYDHDQVDEETLGEELMQYSAVIGVSYISDIYRGFMDTITSLDLITHVLVISAALLTLIVLYNLTNINVAERIRELSTIKVLGFYDREVTQYVYRENWILTGLGIVAGYIGGWFLHQFLIRTTEVDLLLFSRRIDWTSYLYAALLVLLFSLIVMVIIHRRLKNIDMVDALKGGE